MKYEITKLTKRLFKSKEKDKSAVYMVKLYKIVSRTQCCNDHFTLKTDQFFITLASAPGIIDDKDTVVI